MALVGDNVVVKLTDKDTNQQTFAAGDIIGVDIPQVRDQYDVTGFGDPVRKYINGQLQLVVTLRGYLTTTATTGTHTVLCDVYQLGKTTDLEVIVPVGASPASGDPKFTGAFIVESYVPVVEMGKAVMFAARLRPATNTAPSWSAVP